MKHKAFAFVLALTIASWAQTATQTARATSQQSTAPLRKQNVLAVTKWRHPVQRKRMRAVAARMQSPAAQVTVNPA